MCPSGNDIGRAYSMSHAEPVAGGKYGYGIFVSWLELATLDFERFFERSDELELAIEAKEARTVRWERKCGQACGWLWSSWGKSERGAGGWLGMAWDGFFNMVLVFGGLSSGQSVPGEG